MIDFVPITTSDINITCVTVQIDDATASVQWQLVFQSNYEITATDGAVLVSSTPPVRIINQLGSNRSSFSMEMASPSSNSSFAIRDVFWGGYECIQQPVVNAWLFCCSENPLGYFIPLLGNDTQIDNLTDIDAPPSIIPPPSGDPTSDTEDTSPHLSSPSTPTNPTYQGSVIISNGPGTLEDTTPGHNDMTPTQDPQLPPLIPPFPQSVATANRWPVTNTVAIIVPILSVILLMITTWAVIRHQSLKSLTSAASINHIPNFLEAEIEEEVINLPNKASKQLLRYGSSSMGPLTSATVFASSHTRSWEMPLRAGGRDLSSFPSQSFTLPLPPAAAPEPPALIRTCSSPPPFTSELLLPPSIWATWNVGERASSNSLRSRAEIIERLDPKLQVQQGSIKIIFRSSSCKGDLTALMIEKKLGSGAQGTVYQASHKDLGKVAVKLIPISGGSEDESKALFAAEREMSVLSSLSHPNIPTLYGAYLSSPNICLVSQMADQGSLHHRLHGKFRDGTLVHESSFSLREILAISCDIARAMEYLHAHQIVHRDLKPSNILLLSKEGGLRALVCDFGLARSRAATMLSTKNVQAGTPPFMAPEMFEGRPISDRVDLYAYAVCLWELLHRKQAWIELDHPMQVIFHVGVHGRRPAIDKSVCPPPLEQLIRQCWHEEPDLRPTFTEVLSVLQIIEEGLDSHSHHTIVSIKEGEIEEVEDEFGPFPLKK